MRVFVTGATGFMGSAVVQDPLASGHEVLGLARSDAAADALKKAGAKAHVGHIQDLDRLRSGAASSDGVIHMAFDHDFTRFKEASEEERRAIEALGSALASSGKPLIITSGTALISPGKAATEADASLFSPDDLPRIATEQAAAALADQGVHVALVRLPPSVHGEGDHAFVPALIGIARSKGVSAYVGEGKNRWAAVHRLDAARVFTLALENATAGARYHAIAEEGIPFREIAAAIGKGLNLPVVSKSVVEANEHFGFFARFAGLDTPASSEETRELLGWRPQQPGLLSELAEEFYFRS